MECCGSRTTRGGHLPDPAHPINRTSPPGTHDSNVSNCSELPFRGSAAVCVLRKRNIAQGNRWASNPLTTQTPPCELSHSLLVAWRLFVGAIRHDLRPVGPLAYWATPYESFLVLSALGSRFAVGNRRIALRTSPTAPYVDGTWWSALAVELFPSGASLPQHRDPFVGVQRFLVRTDQATRHIEFLGSVPRAGFEPASWVLQLENCKVVLGVNKDSFPTPP